MAELREKSIFPSALGIRGRIVAAVALTAVAAIALVGIISIGLLQKSMLKSKALEAEVTTRLFKTTFAVSKNHRDTEATAALINDLMAGAKILAIRVEEDDGRTVFSTGELPSGGTLFMKFTDIEVWVIGGGFMNPGSMLLVKPRPGNVQNGAPTIQFAVSLEELSGDIAFMRNLLVLYAVVDVFVIMFLGGYLMSFLVVRPLKKLEMAASSIAAGDLDKRVDVSGDDEIGSLGSAFNTMAMRLEGEILALGRSNRELTETKDELSRAATLASVGRLAAGVAHEVGNPLGSVSGYLGILQKSLEKMPEEKEIADRALKEISRVNAMLKDFLSMSRPPKSHLAVCDVNAALTEVLELFSMDEKYKGVCVRPVLNRNIPLASVDPEKLSQVFLNMLRNAADATDGGGTVTVISGTEEVIHERREDTFIRRTDDVRLYEGERRKRWVTVAFEDNGAGMGREVLERVFDPFFTTKAPGHGTGLGLFISNGIVKAYGGVIEVQSEQGKGSVFKIMLQAKEGGS